MSLASNVTGRKVVDRLPVELYEQLIFNFIATQSLDTINDSITKLCIIEPSLKAKWPALKNQWRAQIVEFLQNGTSVNLAGLQSEDFQPQMQMMIVAKMIKILLVTGDINPQSLALRAIDPPLKERFVELATRDKELSRLLSDEYQILYTEGFTVEQLAGCNMPKISSLGRNAPKLLKDGFTTEQLAECRLEKIYILVRIGSNLIELGCTLEELASFDLMELVSRLSFDFTKLEPTQEDLLEFAALIKQNTEQVVSTVPDADHFLESSAPAAAAAATTDDDATTDSDFLLGAPSAEADA